MKKLAFLFLFGATSIKGFTQGTFSGDLMMNLNFFQRDTSIRASGNPLYENYLSGSEGWLGLRYNIKGFTFFVRADAFANSNLKNPTSASTDFGIGAWNITKDMKDLSISVGYIYDQIGSGILFRSYEDRGLLIDNALVGIELKYKLTKNINAKGFVGQIKNNSSILLNKAVHTPPYGPVVKGLDVEGDFNVGKVHLAPGVAMINKTLDQDSYNQIVATEAVQGIDSANPRFTPQYNVYAGTIYNTLSYKNFSWYVECAYKTHEAIVYAVPYDSLLQNKLVDTPGNIEYTSINYGRKGFAISLTGKRTQNFVMRTSANELLLNGLMNWQPVIAVQRPERLISRYTPASQDISEQAGTANLFLTPNDNTTMTFTYTNINSLNNVKLYREGYGDIVYQRWDKWHVQLGVQYLEYNLAVYYVQQKLDPVLKAITPFTEITYRINERQSLRMELQYMSTKQDYGSWAFALLEYNVAPKFSVSVSDMYNTDPNKTADNPNKGSAGQLLPASHYYNIYAAYTKGANRFSIAYVKQVDGINCTGGVCRYEPAFSGVKATVTSSF